MRVGAPAVGAVLAGVLLTPPGTPQARVDTVRMTIHHSRFEPAAVTVRAGSTVRFVVRNLDPIDHELIVGDAAAHARHEEGVERHHHGDVPGEVSVPIGETAATTYRFDEPGTILFACHLPGHFRYGMRGTLVVTP